MKFSLSPRPSSPPGLKEPVMIRASMLRVSIPVACLLVAVFALSPAAVAGPDPETAPPIDWRDFVDHDTDGDHVVGEEMCARPR